MHIMNDENFGLLLKAAVVTLPTKIEKTIQMAEKGELGNDASRIFAFLASERYPGDRLAISKFMSDEDGSRLNNALVRAERAAKLQGHFDPSHNPANEQKPQPEPNVAHPSEEPTTNADEDTPSKFAAYAKEMIDAHAAQNGISQHHAIDDLLKTSPYFRILLNAAKGQTVQHSRATQEISGA
jgi:hypothetical protein